MSHRYRPLRFMALAIATLLVTLLATALAGCGVTSTGPVTRLAATPSPTFGPTDTPIPFGQKCSTLNPPGSQTMATVGDIQFTAVFTTLSGDPLRQLPDNLPSKPYQLNGVTGEYLATFPMVNLTFYAFSLCNTSKTKSHILSAMTVKLDAFQADNNTINTTQYCIRLYSRQGMVDHSGCGGGFAGGDVNLDASFAGNGTVGTVIPTTPDPKMGSEAFPLTLAPGYGVYSLFDIMPPTTPGSSSYRLGVALDGAAPIYPVPATAPVMNTKTLRQWDGDACLSDAMQQQMPPATTPPTYYICPQP